MDRFRLRQREKGPPLFLVRPPEVKTDDWKNVLMEAHGAKRSLSPTGQVISSEAPSKAPRTEDESAPDECLVTELVRDHGPAP